ncbi:MAG: peroxidase-related enzyme [Acidobacteriota bacterium]
MSRINPIQPETASAEARQILDQVKAKMGGVPNILGTMAQAPAVAQAYLGFSGALGEGALDAKLRELIALTVAEANNCDYCLAAHSTIGKGAGLSQDQILAGRRAQAEGSREQAALSFARLLVENRGRVTDGEVDGLRAAGFSDGEVLEIVANVALNLFTNYFNHVADPAVDFPVAPPLAAATA